MNLPSPWGWDFSDWALTMMKDVLWVCPMINYHADGPGRGCYLDRNEQTNSSPFVSLSKEEKCPNFPGRSLWRFRRGLVDPQWRQRASWSCTDAYVTADPVSQNHQPRACRSAEDSVLCGGWNSDPGSWSWHSMWHRSQALVLGLGLGLVFHA
jgi:hypothetical protein